MNDIAKIPSRAEPFRETTKNLFLNTCSDTKEKTKDIISGNNIAFILSKINGEKVLTTEEEIELFERLQSGDKSAESILVKKILN